MGQRWLIGAGSGATFHRSTQGPIILAHGPTEVNLDNLTIENATGASGAGTTGFGLRCEAALGTPTLSLVNVTVRNNEQAGVSSQTCTFSAVGSHFESNGYHGLNLIDTTVSIDRCVAINNVGSGMNLDSGLFTVVNSIIARNQRGGLVVAAGNTGHRIEFNTIVDNVGIAGVDAGFNCDVFSGLTATNNIIARNDPQTRSTNCSFTNSLVADTDISAIKFVSPDTTPYDYHLMAGSIAIDMAAVSTLDHDIDGNVRPAGAGRDVGADEFTP
jgi:hypothetical protein